MYLRKIIIKYQAAKPHLCSDELNNMDPLSAAAPILRSVFKSAGQLGWKTSGEVRGGGRGQKEDEGGGGIDVVGGWEESTARYDASEANAHPRPTPKKRALAFSACIAVLTCVILLAQIFYPLIIRLAEKDELWQSIYKYLKKRCFPRVNNDNDSMLMIDE